MNPMPSETAGAAALPALHLLHPGDVACGNRDDDGERHSEHGQRHEGRHRESDERR